MANKPIPETILNGQRPDATRVMANHNWNNDWFWVNTAFPTGSNLKGEGQYCYRTDLNKAYLYNGSSWDPLGVESVGIGTADPDDSSIKNTSWYFYIQLYSGHLRFWIRYSTSDKFSGPVGADLPRRT